MKKHILVISQYYYPEQFRINDICEEWLGRGYRVTVVTGIPNYPEGKFYKGYNWFNKRKENVNGVNVIRLPIIPRGKNTIGLCINYMSFLICGFVWKLTTQINADLVFVFGVSPMTQLLVGVWYSKKKKVPCHLYIQDLWPENIEIITGIHNRCIIGPIEKMVDYTYAQSTKIFTTSKSFITSLIRRKVPPDKLVFWPQYAEDFCQPSAYYSGTEIPEDNKFNIIFAGNIGVAQGLDVLIDIGKYIKKNGLEDKKIRFILVGDGRYKNTLIEKVTEEHIDDLFLFIGKKSPEEIPGYLSRCNACFISLQNNALFESTIPAKLQTYLACGKPIIAVAKGETEKIVLSANAGFVSHQGDLQGLVNNIKKISQMSNDGLNQMGLNARKYYEENFDKQKLLDAMDKYLGEV